MDGLSCDLENTKNCVLTAFFFFFAKKKSQLIVVINQIHAYADFPLVSNFEKLFLEVNFKKCGLKYALIKSQHLKGYFAWSLETTTLE